jgi:uncharacterized surface protein with fasciclin (FAS1) repeats
MRLRTLLLGVLALLFVILAPRSYSNPPVSSLGIRTAALAAPENLVGGGAVGLMDIVDTVREAGTLDYFSGALAASGADRTLRERGPFTVFAPTDQAFAKIPPEEMNQYLKDGDRLRQMVLAHVVKGHLKFREFGWISEADTLVGTSVRISRRDSAITFGDASLAGRRIQASNGVIYTLDRVSSEGW